jgi:hypothetical protein
MTVSGKKISGVLVGLSLAATSTGAFAHAGANTVLGNINIDSSLVGYSDIWYAEGDYLVPHMTLYNNSGTIWSGVTVTIETWDPYALTFVDSPLNDAISFGQYTTTGDADWATQGGPAGLHVKLDGIYQCNGVDATSYCLGDGTTGQVSNPGSWSWTRSLDPDTYAVTLDPSKLVVLPGHNLHVGGYEIEYGSQTENFRLRFNVAEFTPVPLPASLWLFASGMLGVFGAARRSKAARR